MPSLYPNSATNHPHVRLWQVLFQARRQEQVLVSLLGSRIAIAHDIKLSIRQTLFPENAVWVINVTRRVPAENGQILEPCSGTVGIMDDEVVYEQTL